LDDGSLKGFFARAGIVDADDFEARHKKLRDIGVAVLGEGEIEDYYPAHCLAELAGCGPEEVAGLTDQWRDYATSPEQVEVVAQLIADNRSSICDSKRDFSRQDLTALIQTARATLRDLGKLPTRHRKTGSALEKLIGITKPTIATRVGRWFQRHPQEVPEKLQNLVRLDSG
jgi:hypothetical protein